MNEQRPPSKRFEWARGFVPRSVGVRVALAVNLLVIVCGMGFLIVDYQQESRQRLTDKALALREEAMTIHQGISGLSRKSVEDQQRFINAVCRRMSDDESPGHHIVVEIDGKALQSQAHHRDSEQALQAVRAASGRSPAEVEDTDLLVGWHREAGITVYVAERMTSVQTEIRRQAMLRSVGIVLFGLLLALAVSLVIHRLVHKPLRRLVKTIDSIAAGDYRKTNGRFDGAELAQVAAAVDSMSHSLARAEEHRKASLDRARRVQEHLLPQNGGGNGLDIAFFHNAAEDVAGDYVDVFQTNRGTTVICVADVVGHGIAAAMIAAMLKVLLLDAAEVHDDPGEMLGLLNRRFSTVNLPGDFATVFLAGWRPASRTLCYANAGHEPALLLSSDRILAQLDSTGIMLGIEPAMTWKTQAVQIAAGDCLACWTDGITEAWGNTNEMFGRDRLISLIEQGVGAGPRAIVEEVERAIQEHARGRPFSDDCTFLAVCFS